MQLPELERIFSCIYEDFIIFCFDDNEPIRASSCKRTLPSSFRIFVNDPVITTLSFSTEIRLKINDQDKNAKKRPAHIDHIIWDISYGPYHMV